ncbi:hypothetical protein AAC387_Pa03g0054 [Persea americana]|eukprot:TRINITY_DN49998_c0_g1_i1.p1 TRINITY_DN49998_c0_g1~~TRINITY_DN49998_c0_g1_i1.p1  ORF type:complete len:117 (-),score=17.05 TRINITY_DN49998_c0_g1_i1:79-429(-)
MYRNAHTSCLISYKWVGCLGLVVVSGIDDQGSRAHGTKELPFGLEENREKAKPPLAFNVHGLHKPTTVGARSWRRLPAQHLLFLVAHEYQTHLCLLLPPPPPSSFSALLFVWVGES